MTAKKAKTTQPTAKPESRRERRKRETRERLMRAALTLMSEVGMEGAVINQITEAADVGFGSFYNHFESKEDIYNQLVFEVMDTFADALNQLSETIDDPAEVMAASSRFMLHKIIQDPVWGRFVVRINYSSEIFVNQRFGQYFLRDLQIGIASGRFKFSDPLMAAIAASGTLLAAANLCAEPPVDESSDAPKPPSLFLDKEGLPERTAAMMLKIFGLEESDAVEVANRPLPDITFD